MELHRKLTIIGMVLLVATYLLNSRHEEGFNYAYVPGIAMIVSLGAGFVIFTKDRLRDS